MNSFASSLNEFVTHSYEFVCDSYTHTYGSQERSSWRIHMSSWRIHMNSFVTHTHTNTDHKKESFAYFALECHEFVKSHLTLIWVRDSFTHTYKSQSWKFHVLRADVSLGMHWCVIYERHKLTAWRNMRHELTCYALMCQLVFTVVSYVWQAFRNVHIRGFVKCVTNSLVTHWCVSWYLLLCHMFDKLSGMFIYGGSYTLECNLVWVRHTFIWIRVWLIHTHIQMHWSVIDQLTSFQDSSHITRQSTRTPSTQLILFSKLIRFFFTISCEWVYECDIWVGDGQVLSEIISVLHE